MLAPKHLLSGADRHSHYLSIVRGLICIRYAHVVVAHQEQALEATRSHQVSTILYLKIVSSSKYCFRLGVSKCSRVRHQLESDRIPTSD